ncbi:rhodanese-like domain-containing protein [Halosimplex pelagicum]|uniref:Rhodanese-like domain-containing protein n=1 Tax=Halosimplex pelagicum TaxID=869886 RepID=A0A7D5P432_9EURY|nr:rhodanese-like domain-containing protein [Halosimplex pelagicum]QLH80406.1 rhodanese-like domain-containing protein [Halosimplex pelagicum]
MDGEISGEELQELLDDGSTEDATDDLRIVDIRNPGSFERGHIPGSENIPANRLTDRVEELDGAERVVTVCPKGKSSVQAARLVGSYEGVDGPVESLHGGLNDWEGPLESADATDDGDGSAAPF